MKKDNKFLAWLRRPHGFLLVLVYLLTAIAIAGSVVAAVMFLTADGNTLADVLCYVLFVVAAILLGYTVYTVVIYAPVMKSKGKELLQRNRFTAKILEDYGFKTAFFALFSFAVTFAFTVMNTVSAVRYASVWYGALAGYYAILMALRGGTVGAGSVLKRKQGENGTELGEWKIYRAGGACLLVLEVAMAAAVTQLMILGRPTQSGQIMAIANAAYTFYKVSMAIRNLLKARKFRSPLTQALRNYGFADACMSVVSLTVLMISTFSDGAEQMEAMIYLQATIGFAGCATIIALATIMLVRACKRIKNMKTETDDGREEI